MILEFETVRWDFCFHFPWDFCLRRLGPLWEGGTFLSENSGFNDQGRITSNEVLVYLILNYHYAYDTVYRWDKLKGPTGWRWNDEKYPRFQKCFSDFKVRLTGSNFSVAGTIEVTYYGVWGGVLGDGYFDINAGHVVCRQLGYHSADEIYQYAAFGRLTGPLWIWRMHCNGNESNISDCAVTTWDKNSRYGWWESYLQRPHFAAGVLCRQTNFNPLQSK